MIDDRISCKIEDDSITIETNGGHYESLLFKLSDNDIQSLVEQEQSKND